MDERGRHHAADIARILTGVGVLIMAICLVVLVAWVVTAEQKTKLYEADNVVCASQPFAMHCFERKTNP